jgi:hypothetical protein
MVGWWVSDELQKVWKNWPWLYRGIIPTICLNEVEGNFGRRSVTIASVPVQVRTERVPTTSLERHRCANPSHIDFVSTFRNGLDFSKGEKKSNLLLSLLMHPRYSLPLKRGLRWFYEAIQKWLVCVVLGSHGETVRENGLFIQLEGTYSGFLMLIKGNDISGARMFLL